MENYIFRSLDGVSDDRICSVFSNLLSNEMITVGCFNYKNYEWCIGIDVVRKIDNFRRRNVFPIITGPNRILGIHAVVDFDVESTEISLRLKPYYNDLELSKLDVASIYPRFTVDPIVNGKSMMQLRHSEEMMKKITFNNPASIKNVIFNDPATIVFWNDGTKTVVKAENEEFDPEKGLAMAISKKFLGNQGNYYETFKKWLPEKESELKSVWTTTVQSVSLNDVISDFREAVEKINNIKIDIEKEDKKDE